jgi:hypothetical protein
MGRGDRDGDKKGRQWGQGERKGWTCDRWSSAGVGGLHEWDR